MNRFNRFLLAIPNRVYRTSFHTTGTTNLKKIQISQDAKEKTITIEGQFIDSKEVFGNGVLKLDKTTSPEPSPIQPCPLCMLEKKNIFVQYTDVLVLRQFLTQDGVVLPMSVTGLCRRQHKKVVVMAKLAKQAGLILDLQPRLLDGSMPNTDPRKRPAHLKWNSYFDDYETMIKKTKFI